MNVRQYILSRSRSYQSVINLCHKHGIGKRELVKGRWQITLTEADVQNLDGRWRKE